MSNIKLKNNQYSYGTKRQKNKSQTEIAVLGAGDMSRALAVHLGRYGYNVIVGSRHQNVRREQWKRRGVATAKIVSIETCLWEAHEIVIVALHYDHIAPTLRQVNQDLLKDKILVDISNPEPGKNVVQWSQAETIAQMVQQAKVVKAFNSLSAYSIDAGMVAGRVVEIAGDDTEACDEVAALARGLGLTPVYVGQLEQAREMEAAQLHVWGSWLKPCFISGALFTAWGVYGTFRYQIWKGNPWSMWPVNTLNKVYSCTALTLLAACYTPGCIAGLVQLVRGTRHSAFPQWLDAWLRMRKELGLISLSLAATHCVLSVAHLSPAYFPTFFEKLASTAGVVDTRPQRLLLRSEMQVLFGSMSLGIMSVLGVTSLPDVAQRLTWRQWDLLHTRLGYMCLALGTAHVCSKGLPDWLANPLQTSIKGMAMLSIVLPVTTMASRVLLSLPFIRGRLARIRRGE